MSWDVSLQLAPHQTLPVVRCGGAPHRACPLSHPQAYIDNLKATGQIEDGCIVGGSTSHHLAGSGRSLGDNARSVGKSDLYIPQLVVGKGGEGGKRAVRSVRGGVRGASRRSHASVCDRRRSIRPRRYGLDRGYSRDRGGGRGHGYATSAGLQRVGVES